MQYLSLHTLYLHLETAKENAANDLWSELDILLKIEPHPNICNLLGCCDDKGIVCTQSCIQQYLTHTFSLAKSLFIILEYCMLGRLKDYLQSCNSALEKMGLPIELRDYQNSGKGRGCSCSTDYVNILRSTASSSSYAKLLRKVSVESTQSDSVFYHSSIAYAPESIDSDYNSLSYAGSMITLSRDYENSPGLLYNEDVASFALQIAHGLQHLEKLKVCMSLCVCMHLTDVYTCINICIYAYIYVTGSAKTLHVRLFHKNSYNAAIVLPIFNFFVTE